MLQQASSDKMAAQQRLIKILQTETSYEAAHNDLSKVPLDYNPDSLVSHYEQSAVLSYLHAGLTVSRQSVQVQKSTLSPRIGVGYFNQSIDRYLGFDGWEVNVKFPLWFRPNSGQIQSAKIQDDIANNAFQQQYLSMLADLRVLSNQRNTLLDMLDTYERVSLRNADLIMENADLLFKNGEIEYLEYITSIGQALSMKLVYLDSINEYNLVTLKMNYLVK